MRQGKGFDMGRAGRRLAAAASWTVRIAGTAIFLFLTWYSMRYTQYINPGGEERPLNVRDSMLQNLFVLLLVTAVFVWLMQLEKHISEGMQQRIRAWTLAAVILWTGAAGFWWITSAQRIPEGDQAFVYGGASYFLEGDFGFLSRGAYFGIYPHQLGLVALTELLFLFTGTYNYFAFQLVNVILAMGIVYMGCRIVQCFTERMSVSVAYCLAMTGCMPLIFYTGWVYGEIPGIFFAMLAAWMLLRYAEEGHWGYLAAVVCALSLGVLVRKNSWILVIAFCIIALVRAVRCREMKIAAAAVLSVLLPLILYAGVYKMYELRSGHEHSSGMPTAAWIAMGLQESSGKYGWYNHYGRQILWENDYDETATEEIVKESIKSSVHNFVENPSYAWTFFREKVLSQWNEPLYQSLFFTTKYQEEHMPPEGSFVLKITGEYFTRILRLCDRLQFVLYFGMLLYFVFGVAPRSEILRHLLAVAVIGGFLFSIIWEAKARYVFPYYITMFPLAAAGYWQMLAQLSSLFQRREREQSGNITKFRKAA